MKVQVSHVEIYKAKNYVILHMMIYLFTFYISVSGEMPQLNISYKPQKISPKYSGMVRNLLHEKIRDAYVHPQV
jgi:translation initiation factor RLI1